MISTVERTACGRLLACHYRTSKVRSTRSFHLIGGPWCLFRRLEDAAIVTVSQVGMQGLKSASHLSHKKVSITFPADDSARRLFPFIMSSFSSNTFSLSWFLGCDSEPRSHLQWQFLLGKYHLHFQNAAKASHMFFDQFTSELAWKGHLVPTLPKSRFIAEHHEQY